VQPTVSSRCTTPLGRARERSARRGKMRVVFVNRFYRPDGSATSQLLTDLAEHLARLQIEVLVLCSRQLYEDPNARLRRRETMEGVRAVRIGTTRFGRNSRLGRLADYLSFCAAATLRLMVTLRRRDILVTMTDPPLLSVIGAGIARMRGCKLVNWLQDVFPEVASRLEDTAMPRWLERSLGTLRDASLRHAHCNVVIGECMREYIGARGIAESRMCVIENWADGEAIRPMPQAWSALRRELGVAASFVVEYSGNLGRAHDYRTLLHAAEHLRLREEIVFLMIGGGTGMAALRRETIRRRLQNFRFLPYQPRDRLCDSLAAGDVHLISLLPAMEGLIVPSKLHGILAAGRAAIFVGDVHGESARSLAAGNCGLSVPTGDGRALAAALERLVEDPATVERMGQSARRLFDERYTMRSARDRWAAVLGVPLPQDASITTPGEFRRVGIRQFGT